MKFDFSQPILDMAAGFRAALSSFAKLERAFHEFNASVTRGHAAVMRAHDHLMLAKEEHYAILEELWIENHIDEIPIELRRHLN